MTAGALLAGKRILVTRAPHQSGSLAGALEEKGAEAVRLSTIAIVPPESFTALDTALHSIESFDWLVLTSANAARFFAERMLELNIRPERLARVLVAAIGPATARAAREHGLAVDLIPEEAVAESLASALKEKLGKGIAGHRILLARAAVARDVIPRELAGMGAAVEVAETYRTVIPAEAVEQVRALFEGKQQLKQPGSNLDAGLPDAATFTSSSTVTNFLALLAAAGLERPRGLRAVSIGPVTTRSLREHGWEPAAEARSASIPELVEACVRLFRS